MGSSLLADALTGLTIPRDEPIVALAVERRRGGYPDATTHGALSPLSPSQLFEPISLPIHGTAGEYAGITPKKGDLGAGLLMDLANKPDWATFSGAAFGYDAGILLGPPAHGLKSPWPLANQEPVPVALGLVVFRKASWDRLVELGTYRQDRARDVETVLDAIAKVRAATAAGDNDVMGMNLGLTRLGSSCLYLRDEAGKEGISTIDLPTLSRAFSGREDGDLLSGTASQWLARRGGILGYGLLKAEPDERVASLLGAVWDLAAAERGMDALNRTWQPSYGSGQHVNAREVASIALASYGVATGLLLNRLEEGMAYEDKAIPEIEAMLERLDEMRASLAERLAAVRAPEGPSL